MADRRLAYDWSRHPVASSVLEVAVFALVIVSPLLLLSLAAPIVGGSGG